ncbi:hypothetical protein LOK49_LG01G02849 [Camellia lanceoleosa]|uniref:Uncharacterized protein n=1 Tax=Camellia lanceoleosa TaxID=1840588 RepID=A0ACC0J5T6_9ERIC|nr:hypothetical protein LOK49_LG01G02849 [Camellia lanceoleosa]
MPIPNHRIDINLVPLRIRHRLNLMQKLEIRKRVNEDLLLQNHHNMVPPETNAANLRSERQFADAAALMIVPNHDLIERVLRIARSNISHTYFTKPYEMQICFVFIYKAHLLYSASTTPSFFKSCSMPLLAIAMKALLLRTKSVCRRFRIELSLGSPV